MPNVKQTRVLYVAKLGKCNYLLDPAPRNSCTGVLSTCPVQLLSFPVLFGDPGIGSPNNEMTRYDYMACTLYMQMVTVYMPTWVYDGGTVVMGCFVLRFCAASRNPSEPVLLFLHYTALHCIAPHCTTEHVSHCIYTAIHCTALHCITVS